MDEDRRPGLYEFTSDTPEFHRWYEHGGNPREKPLELGELEKFYQQKGYSAQDSKAAAWSSGARDQQTKPEKEADQNQVENTIDPVRGIEKEGVTQASDPNAFLIPDRIKKNYLQVGNRFHYERAPEKVAFEDKGRKLHTRSNGATVVSSMVEIAQARGWTEIKVQGSNEFRQKVWLKASAQGLNVKGYKPQEADLAALEKQLSQQAPKEVQKSEKASRLVGQTSRTPNEKPVDRLSGELVDHGPAPFEFDKNNPENYFAKLKNADGKERIVWGVDLGRALGEKEAGIGDRITLENQGNKSVKVERAVKDVRGNRVGTEPAEVHREIWKVHAQAVRDKKPEELVKDHPELRHEAATLKLAEKVAERFPDKADQLRFLDQVQNRVAAKVEQGQPSPQVKVRETRQVQAVREEQAQRR